MKRIYQKPFIINIHIQTTPLLTNSVTDVDGNGDMKYGGGGNGPARSREISDWDEE